MGSKFARRHSPKVQERRAAHQATKQIRRRVRKKLGWSKAQLDSHLAITGQSAEEFVWSPLFPGKERPKDA